MLKLQLDNLSVLASEQSLNEEILKNRLKWTLVESDPSRYTTYE